MQAILLPWLQTVILATSTHDAMCVLVITKTRIAKGVQQRLYWEDPLSSRDIKDAIEKCQLDILPGEYAEMLLKYLPTKEEV